MATQLLQPSEVDTPPTLALQLDGECGMDPREIAPAMSEGFGALMAAAGEHRLQCVGAPRVLYTGMGPRLSYTLALPVAGAGTGPGEGRVRLAELPAAHTLRFTHVGPYDRLGQTYGEITAWMIAQGRMQSEADWGKYMPMWEEYAADPETTPPSELVTFIHLPLGG